MKTIGLVPARCGSKEIPLKNIKSFCGKPLIYWSLRSLALSPDIDEVILATDCDEIATVAQSLDIEKLSIFKRSPQSATDKAATELVMLEYVNATALATADRIVLLQATSPFTTVDHVNGAIQLLTQQRNDSLLSCARTHNFYWSEDATPINYDYTNRPMRQDFKGNLQENGAIYITTVEQLTTSQNRLGGSIGIYEMPEYTALELDKPFEWNVAEAIMRNYNFDIR